MVARRDNCYHVFFGPGSKSFSTELGVEIKYPGFHHLYRGTSPFQVTGFHFFFLIFNIACLPPSQMGIASIVHLYVFPAKPYELLGKHYSPENISVLGDYAASDPVDPDEVKDITRPTKIRYPQVEPDEIYATNIKESVRDFVVGSGEYVSF